MNETNEGHKGQSSYADLICDQSLDTCANTSEPPARGENGGLDGELLRALNRQWIEGASRGSQASRAAIETTAETKETWSGKIPSSLKKSLTEELQRQKLTAEAFIREAYTRLAAKRDSGVGMLEELEAIEEVDDILALVRDVVKTRISLTASARRAIQARENELAKRETEAAEGLESLRAKLSLEFEEKDKIRALAVEAEIERRMRESAEAMMRQEEELLRLSLAVEKSQKDLADARQAAEREQRLREVSEREADLADKRAHTWKDENGRLQKRISDLETKIAKLKEEARECALRSDECQALKARIAQIEAIKESELRYARLEGIVEGMTRVNSAGPTGRAASDEGR